MTSNVPALGAGCPSKGMVSLAGVCVAILLSNAVVAADRLPVDWSRPPATSAETAPEWGRPFGVDWNITAAVAGELRVFEHAGDLPGQKGGHLFPAGSGWFKVSHQWNDDRDRISVEPFFRYDPKGDRDLFDLREGYYKHDDESWSVLVGTHIVFWGVAESRHLVNVVNQIDLKGDVDEEDRLSQPMVNLNIDGGENGMLSLFALLGFREEKFPNLPDRLRGSVIVDDDKSLSKLGFATRYFNTFNGEFGSVDYAISYFNGTGRMPRLSLTPTTAGLVLTPQYDRIDQAGAEILYTWQDLQLKFEGAWIHQFGEDIAAVVSGFEYTLNGIGNTGMDLGLLAEYLYDDRSDRQPPTIYDNDVFLGTRLTFNNVLNTHLLGGVVVDLDNGGTYGSVEFMTRMTDDISLELEGRLFSGFKTSEPASILNSEDFLQVRVIKYF